MSINLADTIKDRMGETETSMVALSAAAHIARSTLIRKLDAETPLTVVELASIAEALGMSADELYRDARAAAYGKAA